MRKSRFSEEQIIAIRVVEHHLGQELLQLRVLVLERVQALRVRHIHAAELRLPLVERRAGYPVLAADIRCWPARLLLAQRS